MIASCLSSAQSVRFPAALKDVYGDGLTGHGASPDMSTSLDPSLTGASADVAPDMRAAVTESPVVGPDGAGCLWIQAGMWV